MRSKFLWAALALVAVLAITTAASATTRGLITGKQIAPHSINSKHLVNHTIKAHDLSSGLIKSLHGAKGARGPVGLQGPSGPQGPAGPAGPQGPAAPPSGSESHISLFVASGHAVATQVPSRIGALGTITFYAGDSSGSINYTPNAQAVAIFDSPEIAGAPYSESLKFAGYPDHLSVPWTTPAALHGPDGWEGTITFEMMIESQQADPPLVTTIHGCFFPVGDGYAYYLQIDTSNIAGARAITP